MTKLQWKSLESQQTTLVYTSVLKRTITAVLSLAMTDVAHRFGKELANGFIKGFLEDNLVTEQIVVISSPYCFIPTAAFAMKNHFVNQLNRWLVDHGRLVVQEAKVHRTITYKEDYGELSAEDRMKLIGNDSFHIDKDFLEGKTLFFLDDIKITGSHEKMIMKMVREYGPEE